LKINVKPRQLYRGYLVVAACFLIATVAWGANRTFGVFFEPMLDEFGWTRAATSGAFTIVMIIMGVFTLVTGRLTDRYGPRPVLISCGLLMGISYICTSQVNTIWQLYIFLGLLGGIGMSGFFAPLMSTVARWFSRRRAMMSGIVVAGPALGIVIMPLVFTSFIDTYGWRTSYTILGSVVLLLIILAASVLKRDHKSGESPPYIAEEAIIPKALLRKDLCVKEALHTKQLWLITIVNFCDMFLVNTIIVHLVAHTTGIGFGPTSAASVLSLAAGVSIPARIIVGGIADKLGYKSTFLINLSMSVLAFTLLLFANNMWMLYLFSILYGIGLWSSASIVSPLIAKMFGLKSHATLLSITVLAGSIGGATGPVLSGYIYDVNQNYQVAFICCLVISIISFTSLSLLRPINR